MLNPKRTMLPMALALLSLATVVSCSEQTTEPAPTFTAFSISVKVQNATVDDVTAAMASFIHEVDDTGRGLPADWIVAGGDQLEVGAPADEAALKLPGGTRIVEVCNHHYASQAMAFGNHHGVALPCEIAIAQNGDDVDVVLLNPEAIFSLFFQDVPAEHAAQMGGLAATVRAELEQLVIASLADFTVVTLTEDVGPRYDEQALADLTAQSYAIHMDMDIPTEYLGSADERDAFKALFVETLLQTLTHEHMDTVGSQVEGLSVDDWRSARTHALGLPGGTSVVEMCSPTYATAALSTGTHHAPALPCQLAVWIDGDTLRVDVLDPVFIFPVFFSDAPAEMMEQMGGLATAVRGDIQLIVEAAQATLAPQD